MNQRIVSKSGRAFTLFASGLALLLAAGCASSAATRREMALSQIAFSRSSTDKLLEEIEKTGKGDQVLRWQAGPGRAPIGWQFMHLAASEDYFGAAVFGQNKMVSEKYAKQFRGGPVAPRDIPSLKEVRDYLTRTRAALDASLRAFSFENLERKPNPEARFDFATALKIVMWHEGHHQGQAKATFNIYQKK